MIKKGRRKVQYSINPKTKCKNGHSLIGDNLAVPKTYRYCKKCRKINDARKYQKMKHRNLTTGDDK